MSATHTVSSTSDESHFFTLERPYAWNEAPINFFERGEGVRARMGAHCLEVVVPDALPGRGYSSCTTLVERVMFLCKNACFVAQVNESNQTLKFVACSQIGVTWIQKKEGGYEDDKPRKFDKGLLSSGLHDGHRVSVSKSMNLIYLQVGDSNSLMIGQWKLNAICEVANGILVTATNSTPAKVKFISWKTEERYRRKLMSEECEFERRVTETIKEVGGFDLGGNAIYEIREKKDGSLDLVIRCFDGAIIKTLAPIKRRIREINTLKKAIKGVPEILENYESVIKLYKELGDEESEGALSLEAIKVACLAKNFEAARKFFQRARMIYPRTDKAEVAYYQFLTPRQMGKMLIYDFHEKESHLLTLLPDHLYRYRSRLFVGEGSFAYSRALMLKHHKTHPGLGKAITATSIEKPFTHRNISLIQGFDVTVKFEVDAAIIDRVFAGQRFKRIHWNRPYVCDLHTRNWEEHHTNLRMFFKAAATMQQPHDRIHISLITNGNYYEEVESRNNPVCIFSKEAGYVLVGKRPMNWRRYREFKPVKSTKGNFHYYTEIGESVCVLSPQEVDEELGFSEAREFIFELQGPKTVEKRHEIAYADDIPYYQCSTDEESSDYWDSSDEEPFAATSGPAAEDELDTPSLPEEPSQEDVSTLDANYVSLHFSSASSGEEAQRRDYLLGKRSGDLLEQDGKRARS